MIKETPSFRRMAAMVAFTLSCFGLLLWLWIQFGGPIPTQPQGYRFEASFDEASLLVEQADVRIAGLNVGKVVDKRLDRRNGRTIAEMELDSKYAPIPRDTRAILRIKALLGETYVELSPGAGSAKFLEDGDMLPRTAVQDVQQIDEVVGTFDKPTRRAFQGWMRELADAIDGGRGEDLNDALGTLPDFVATGEDVLRVLDEEDPALRRLIYNGGRTLGALNARYGQFRQLIVNSNNFFGAVASRNESLAETIFILPTFLDESKATLNRLRTFSQDTRPLVRDLQPVARDLAPTLRDVGRLAPDLKHLFRNLDPLIDESKRTLPAASRVLRGAEPLFESLHVYLPELNPIISYINFNQQTVADFLMNSSGTFGSTLPGLPGEGPRHYLRQMSLQGARSLGLRRIRPEYERGNAYPAPNYLNRAKALGIPESWDCKPSGGEKRDPEDGQPPCFVAPKSLYDGRQFPRLGRGDSPLRPNPRGTLGTEPATP